MATTVKIAWHWIDYISGETKGKLKNRLVAAQAPVTRLDRAVYVIRLKAPFAIKYPKSYTPVLYIGEGDLIDRLYVHQKWTSKLLGLGYKFPIEVVYCCPRVQKNKDAYKVFEAHLLETFFERYSSLPLKNSIHEHKAYDHQYDSVATKGILGPGGGSRHTWAIQPLPANPFLTVFQRTHNV